MKDVKVCRECRWHLVHPIRGQVRDQCIVNAEPSRHPITGDVYYPDMMACWFSRERVCGPKGKLWEAKPVKPSLLESLRRRIPAH